MTFAYILLTSAETELLIQARSNQKEERLIKSDPLVFAPFQLKEGQFVILP
jgi:hypothetical protein